MAEIINLRLARKRKVRSESDQAAAANRAKHGRSRAEKQMHKAEKEKARRDLDAIKRDPKN